MEESGISRAVVMGRKADEYGEVDNEDILELARAYPQTFIPFAAAQIGCGTFFAYPRAIRHSFGNKSEGICFLPPLERL